MFTDIIKEALAILKKNPNLVQLFFIFYILITLFTPMLMGVKLNIKAVPMILLWYSLFCSLLAGLYFAFKRSLDYRTEPPKDNSIFLSPLYFSEFLQGVGKYTTKFLLSGLLVLLILFVIGFGYDYILTHYVIIPETFKQLNPEILTNDVKMMEFVNNLSLAEQIKVSKISLLTLGCASIFGLLTMFYPVLLITTECNLVKAFGKSLICLFKKFSISLLLFFFFNIAISFASLIYAGAVNNILVSIIAILLQCYLNVLYTLSLFIYYEKVK